LPRKKETGVTDFIGEKTIAIVQGLSARGFHRFVEEKERLGENVEGSLKNKKTWPSKSSLVRPRSGRQLITSSESPGIGHIGGHLIKVANWSYPSHGGVPDESGRY
jgi:hypothetical protein